MEYDVPHRQLGTARARAVAMNIKEIARRARVFRPLFAQIVSHNRQSFLVRELMNTSSFNRANGIPNVSADSADYVPAC